jgi:predicted transcriptional regulator
MEENPSAEKEAQEFDASFIAAVEQGQASTRRGDLLDHEEVVARIEQILRG